MYTNMYRTLEQFARLRYMGEMNLKVSRPSVESLQSQLHTELKAETICFTSIEKQHGNKLAEKHEHEHPALKKGLAVSVDTLDR